MKRWRTQREEMSQYSTPCTIQYHSKLADFQWLPLTTMDLQCSVGCTSVLNKLRHFPCFFFCFCFFVCFFFFFPPVLPIKNSDRTVTFIGDREKKAATEV